MSASRKRIVAAALGVVALLCLSWFVFGYKLDTTLTLEFEEKVAPISPISLPDSGWGTVINQVFEGLFQITRSGQLEPAIVKEWTVDQSFREFDFQLKSNIFFHNGKQLTSSDVVYSLNHFRKNPPQMSTSFVFSEMLSVEKTSEDRVKIRMKNSAPDFLYFLATPTVKIFPEGVFEKYKDTPSAQWIGTGAFVLKSLTDDMITLERFSGYRESVKLKRILFRRFKNINTAFAEGKMDVLEIFRKDIGKYRNDSRYLVNSYPMLGTFFLGFNLDRHGLKNKNLRKAILFAIDRAKTIEGVTIASGMIPAGAIPYGLLGYKAADTPRDLAKAKVFFAKVPKAELPNDLDLEILMPKTAHPMAVFAVEQIRKDLAALGLTLHTRSLEKDYGRGNWGNYFYHIKSTGDFSFYLRGSIATTPSTDLFLRDLFDPGSLMNLSNYQSAAYREYLKHVPKDILETTLHPYYSKLDELIMEDVPVVPLGNLYYNLVTQKESPYKFNAISPYFLNYKDSL